MPHTPLDALDRGLIAALQTHARESTAELARRLGVARTTVVARLARLEREGVIVGYTVRLGRDVTETAIDAYVGITVAAKAGRAVERALSRMPGRDDRAARCPARRDRRDRRRHANPHLDRARAADRPDVSATQMRQTSVLRGN
jgi:DNA-binding Lrp family transcriptional regulator